MVGDLSVPNAHDVDHGKADHVAGRRNAEEFAVMRSDIGLARGDEIAFGNLLVDLVEVSRP